MYQRYAEKAIRRNSSTPTRDGELSIFSDLIPSALLTYLYLPPPLSPLRLIRWYVSKLARYFIPTGIMTK